MRIFLLICVIFLVISKVEAQHKYEFVGVIKLNDSSLIKYNVFFDINNERVNGFSLTDFGGVHETKTLIDGRYNSETSQLSFSETEMVYTKSPITELDFCNVHLRPVKFKLGKTKYFKGPFDGRFPDGEKCINGEILLNSKANVDRRMAKIGKKVIKSKKVPDSVKTRFKSLRILDSLDINVIKKDEVTSLVTKDDEIELQIYDAGKIDNDKVTLLINNKIKILKYTVLKERKIIKIPLTNKKTRISLVAESIGSIAPNTAMMIIRAGGHEIRTMANLSEGDRSFIDIYKKP